MALIYIEQKPPWALINVPNEAPILTGDIFRTIGGGSVPHKSRWTIVAEDSRGGTLGGGVRGGVRVLFE